MNSVLFVCMGNICRSPSAEGFFRNRVRRAGLEQYLKIDSAGTHGYHVGQPPDDRAIAEAARFDVDIAGLRARKVQADDFLEFDRIIAMDHDNLRILESMKPANARSGLSLMMDFAGPNQPREVPDPYYGTRQDFAYMCTLLEEATSGLLENMRPAIDGD